MYVCIYWRPTSDRPTDKRLRFYVQTDTLILWVIYWFFVLIALLLLYCSFSFVCFYGVYFMYDHVLKNRESVTVFCYTEYWGQPSSVTNTRPTLFMPDDGQCLCWTRFIFVLLKNLLPKSAESVRNSWRLCLPLQWRMVFTRISNQSYTTSA